MLVNDDEERRKWSQNLYGIDTADPGLYDLVVHIKKLTVEDAVDMICDCVSREQFKTTPESQRMIEDLALSAAVEKVLIDVGADFKVCVDNHTAHIEIKAPFHAEEKLLKEIRDVTETVEGISDVKIKCHPIVTLTE